MSFPGVKKDTLLKVAESATERRVLSARFVDFGRVAKSINPIREVKASEITTLEEDPRGLGLVIDGRIMVPWTNICWVEYS